MANKEIRFKTVECRQENKDLILEGYAIVWNDETYIGDDEELGFYESVDKDALKGANMKDVPLRYNHNDDFVILARTRNKSLELIPDEKGLFIRAKLQNDVTQHRDVYNLVKSGLISKMSFAFDVLNQEVNRVNGELHRKILKIGRLYDVSIVDIPAYEQTSVVARSLELVDTNKRVLDNAIQAERLKIKYKLQMRGV